MAATPPAQLIAGRLNRWQPLATPIPRLRMRTLLLWPLVLWLVSTVGVVIAHADPTDPTGMGGLIPIPDLSGAGSKSLFETHSLQFVLIDSDVGFNEPLEALVGIYVTLTWSLTVWLAYGAIGLVYWLLSLTGFTTFTGPLADIIGASSTELLAWLLPSAVVIGLIKSYIQHAGRQAFSSIIWVIVAAAVGSTLAISPSAWVGAANSLRTVGSDAAISIGTNAVTAPDQQIPFQWAETDYGAGTGVDNNQSAGDQQADELARNRNVMLRTSSDATWRGLVATPWCIVEFGSLEACERYGPTIIRGTPEERRQYIDSTIEREEGGADAPTVQWIDGKRPIERLVVSTAALLVVLIFLGGMIVLGFAAIASFISTMLHLLVGVFFSLTWCIEGRPREIGMRWLESLVGTILQGAIALLTFSGVLLLLTTVYSSIGTIGWLPTAGLAIVAVIAGIAFRHQVAGFLGAMSPGRGGSLVMGAVVARTATKMARGAVGAGRNAARGIRGAAAGVSRARPGQSGPAGRGGSTAERDRSRTRATPLHQRTERSTQTDRRSPGATGPAGSPARAGRDGAGRDGAAATSRGGSAASPVQRHTAQQRTAGPSARRPNAAAPTPRPTSNFPATSSPYRRPPAAGDSSFRRPPSGAAASSPTRRGGSSTNGAAPRQPARTSAAPASAAAPRANSSRRMQAANAAKARVDRPAQMPRRASRGPRSEPVRVRSTAQPSARTRPSGPRPSRRMR